MDEPAILAARNWLAKLDNRQYADSWHEAAGVFKDSVSRTHWSLQVDHVRKPLGVCRSRELKLSQSHVSLPNAPDGHYVVLKYLARYEHQDEVLETVTPRLEPDGQWKVCGYDVDIESVQIYHQRDHQLGHQRDHQLGHQRDHQISHQIDHQTDRAIVHPRTDRVKTI